MAMQLAPERDGCDLARTTEESIPAAVPSRNTYAQLRLRIAIEPSGEDSQTPLPIFLLRAAALQKTSFSAFAMVAPRFSRINQSVSVHYAPTIEPDRLEQGGKDTSFRAPPRAILLLPWGDAPPRQIDKFTALHAAAFPGATIIVVQSSALAEFSYRSEGAQRRLMESAVGLLRGIDLGGLGEGLLVHVMSNTGAMAWRNVVKSYNESSSAPTTAGGLSGAVVVFDSAPGRWAFYTSWKALTSTLPSAFLPRMALGAVFWVILCTVEVGKQLSWEIESLERVRQEMNDDSAAGAAATRKTGVRRCYIYSEEDEIVLWRDVEEHAREAELKGWDVRRAKFNGSRHVGHFKKDPERYREALEEAWYRNGSTSGDRPGQGLRARL